jgi:hypothetical protein
LGLLKFGNTAKLPPQKTVEKTYSDGGVQPFLDGEQQDQRFPDAASIFGGIAAVYQKAE